MSFPIGTRVEEPLGSGGEGVIRPGQLCGFNSRYWRVRFADNGWGELTATEMTRFKVRRRGWGGVFRGGARAGWAVSLPIYFPLSLPPPLSLCPSLLLSRFPSLSIFLSRVGGVNGITGDETEGVTARLGAFSCFRGEDGKVGDGAVSLSLFLSPCYYLCFALSFSLSAMPKIDRRVGCRTGACVRTVAYFRTVLRPALPCLRLSMYVVTVVLPALSCLRLPT